MSNIALFGGGGNIARLLLVAGLVAVCDAARSQSLFTNDARNCSAGGFVTAFPSPWGIPAVPASDSSTTVAMTCAVIPSPFGVPSLRTMIAAGSLQVGGAGFGLGASQAGTTVFRELVVRTGAAVPIGPDFTCSVALVWHRMTFERYGSASTWTTDLGLRQRLSDDLHVQALFVNAVGRMGGKGIDVPGRQVLGAVWRPWTDLLIAGEVEKELSFPITVRGGIEWTPLSGVVLRAGASDRPAIAAGGLTIFFYGVELTLASVMHDPLGWSQLVECSIHFGGEE